MDEGAISPEEERRLLRLFEEAALQEFPNPARIGCSGKAFLRKLAFDRKSIRLSDERWQHVARCSPCFREFKAFQAEASARRLRTRLATAAVFVVVAVGTGIIFLRSSHPESGADNRLIVATLDLKDRALVRGSSNDGEGPKPDSLSLPRGKVSLDITLPLASEPGDYGVQLLQDVNKPLRSAAGHAQINGGLTILSVRLDLAGLPEGRYLLGLHRVPLDWTYYSVVIR